LGLKGPHRQTIAGNLLPRVNLLPEREKFYVSSGGDTRLLCCGDWQEDPELKLTLIMVHGLGGSSGSQYLVGTANKAFAAGMNAVRMNMRNCGGTEKLTPTLYNSGLFEDVLAVVNDLIARRQARSLGLVGFSMGANLVLNLLGRWAANPPAPVRAAAVVSPLVDLAPSADALHELRNRLYEKYYLRKVEKLYRYKAALFPQSFDATRLRGVRSLREFDDRITAPYSGYRDAADYYDRAASAHVLQKISVPTLMIHSADDPFIRITPESLAKLKANPHIHYFESRHGGHCGFLAKPDGYDGRWAEKTVVEYLAQFDA
jgi:uncharacterized protein